MEQTEEKKLNDMLTVAEAARLAGVTENCLRYQIRAGIIRRYENATGKIRLSRKEIEEKLLTFK